MMALSKRKRVMLSNGFANRLQISNCIQPPQRQYKDTDIIHPLEFKVLKLCHSFLLASDRASDRAPDGASDGVLLMVSGGKDSMALLNIFEKIWRNRLFILNIPLFVMHFNHKKRAAESDQDESFVIDRCIQLGIPCLSFSAPIHIQQASNFQSTARDWRLTTTKHIAQTQLGLKRATIVTAHHAQDQVETMLINLMRGSGSVGVSGMAMFSESLFKPLLSTQSQDLQRYVNECRIAFRHDASNDSNDYKRNQIRHLVIPALKLIEPRFEQQFCQAALNLRQENEIQSQVRAVLIRAWPDLRLSLGQLQNVVDHILKARQSKTNTPIVCKLTKHLQLTITSKDLFADINSLESIFRTNTEDALLK